MNFTGFDMAALQGLKRDHEREGYGAVNMGAQTSTSLDQARDMVRRLDGSFRRGWEGRRIILEVPPRKFTIDFSDWRGEKVLAGNLLAIFRDLVNDPEKHHRLPRLIEWCLDLG